MPPAIIPEKAIILHTLEDAGIYMPHVYIYITFQSCVSNIYVCFVSVIMHLYSAIMFLWVRRKQ